MLIICNALEVLQSILGAYMEYESGSIVHYESPKCISSLDTPTITKVQNSESATPADIDQMLEYNTCYLSQYTRPVTLSNTVFWFHPPPHWKIGIHKITK